MIRIERVLAPNPSEYTLEGTNTWVVGIDPAIVIDPGPAIDAHLDEVARTAGRVGAVLLTHDHPDHAPGAGPFAKRVGAPLHAFRTEGAEHLRDGQTLTVGDVEVVALHTPGHTSDHVAFHLPAEDAIFTGDAVLGRGTSFIDPPDGDLTQYLRSLQRLRGLSPRTLYPGHGPVVFRAIETIQGYLDHREERERQILAVLAAGDGTSEDETGDGASEDEAGTSTSGDPLSIEEIVERVYTGYPPEVLPLAARSVLAHLLKLDAEGRVARTGAGDDASWSLQEARECIRCGRPVRGRARTCPSCSITLLQEGRASRKKPAATDPGPPEAGPPAS